jgi:hypothetical protein
MNSLLIKRLPSNKTTLVINNFSTIRYGYDRLQQVRRRNEEHLPKDFIRYNKNVLQGCNTSDYYWCNVTDTNMSNVS